MRSMNLTGRRQFQLADVPEPRLQRANDVKLRVGAVGVCGSDIHYYDRGRIGGQVVDYPFTVGHECAGTVVEIGAAVTSLQPGDRVAIEPAVTCGRCDQCRAGRSNTCRATQFLGCPGQLPGALRDYLVMPAANCLPLPAAMTLAVATLAEPLAIAIYAAARGGSLAGARIGILGLGPIGLCVVAAARAAGAAAVYCTDPVEARYAAARRFGVTWAGPPEAATAELAAAEPLGLDIVFECCGRQVACDQALELLRPGGQLRLIGIPESERLSFLADRLRRQEVTLVNIRRQHGCTEAALDLIAADGLPAHIITHRGGMTDVPLLFELVRSHDDGVLKAIIEVDQG